MLRRKHNVTNEINRVDQLAGAVLALGALNWGVVGAANFDPIRAALGRTGARAVYGIVGASAAYALARGRQITSH